MRIIAIFLNSTVYVGGLGLAATVPIAQVAHKKLTIKLIAIRPIYILMQRSRDSKISFEGYLIGWTWTINIRSAVEYSYYAL